MKQKTDISTVVARVVSALRATDFQEATKYIDEGTVVTATRPHRKRSSDHAEMFVLKIGRPNFAERTFIAICKKAGEPFPVKRIQFKSFPQ